ncbi:cAMP-dependent protein kinase types I and II, regulatory subunit [Trachipleistophora hominis]|uniref:cAMP-dependent protein kinase types I and II, regulatory subunit n=1 Tax=Trachipleistophora hominis TaxID=72359 RepID=L7JXT8_TRAHO|nr:cAMP-dependent protein kinase types I and II, regulatory subunit [Trachipleistophora hominis]
MNEDEINAVINAKIDALPENERETARYDILYLYNRAINKQEQEGDRYGILTDISERLVHFRLNDLQAVEDACVPRATDEQISMAKRKTIIGERVGKNKRFPKTDEQRRMLNQIFKNTFLLSFLNLRQRRNFVECMQPFDTHKDEVLIRVGDNGDRLYFLERGKFCVQGADGEKELPLHSVIGEIALLHNVPRTATVVSRADGRVWYLERESYHTIRMFDQENKWNIFVKRMRRLNRNVGELASIATGVFVEEGKAMSLEGRMMVVVFDCEVRVGGETRALNAGDIMYDDFVAVSEVEGYVLPRE